MTPRQIELVRATWRQVEPVADHAAALFYTRLFHLDPSLRSLFAGDMEEQGRKLMAMIGFAVNGLSRLDSLRPGLHALGQRHAGYGVREEHYDMVASALLWTLQRALGPVFDPETRAAWIAAYTALSSVMQESAKVAA